MILAQAMLKRSFLKNNNMRSQIMRYKLRVICPVCMLLLVALVVGFCSMTTWAASDSTVETDPAVTISAEYLSAGVDNGRNAAQETLTPAENVSEGEENPQESSEPAEDAETEETEVQATGDSGYELTDEERIAVECAVMCEAGGESVKGQMMVAQSILDGTLRNDFTVIETIQKYQIASTSYSRVTDEVKESVSRVFDDGERITEEKTDLWYNPALVVSTWHESQKYVITVGSHRFFWMLDDM
jgi:spore germination cell wall hydrolase CwlJ-like protein